MTVRNNIPLYELYGEQRDLQEGLPFNIQSIETFLEKTGTYHHAHRHPGLFQWVWVRKGKGKHRIDLQEFEMKPGLLFALHPGIVHDCISEADMEGFILHFSPDFLGLGGNQMGFGHQLETPLYAVFEIPEEAKEQLDVLFQQILDESKAKRSGYELVIKSLIQIILVYAKRWAAVAKATSAAANSLQTDFNQLLERLFRKERSVQAYAEALQVSVPVLNQTIKAFTGLTAREHIQRRILLEAKRQLAYTRQSISELAYELGFEDPNYFWKYFKRHTELTPGLFRQQVQNDRK
ncbi:MAG: helix-turn-helix transcriptional regulator [Saprospiraceae bacterium]|nr:helix-turn-helix transcriptional regulator [Saprospiraceae bacterium]